MNSTIPPTVGGGALEIEPGAVDSAEKETDIGSDTAELATETVQLPSGEESPTPGSAVEAIVEEAVVPVPGDSRPGPTVDMTQSQSQSLAVSTIQQTEEDSSRTVGQLSVLPVVVTPEGSSEVVGAVESPDSATPETEGPIAAATSLPSVSAADELPIAITYLSTDASAAPGSSEQAPFSASTDTRKVTESVPALDAVDADPAAAVTVAELQADKKSTDDDSTTQGMVVERIPEVAIDEEAPLADAIAVDELGLGLEFLSPPNASAASNVSAVVTVTECNSQQEQTDCVTLDPLLLASSPFADDAYASSAVDNTADENSVTDILIDIEKLSVATRRPLSSQ